MTILKSIPVIETDNYKLREVTVGDSFDLFHFMKDKETMKYITPHPVSTQEDMLEKVKGYIEGFYEGNQIPWIISTKSTNEVIGTFRFHKFNLWHKKTEMGVVIRPDYQGKGVMTEVLEVILPYGFNELGLNRIVGDIFADNKGSIRLLEKFGFHKDGVLRQTDWDGTQYHDTVVYSMLRSEFLKG